MSKRSSPKRQPPSIDWRALLTDPLARQILALLILAWGTITLLGLLGITHGRWIDAWNGLLVFWFGWGAYPIAAMIFLAGGLWLYHLIDRPLLWRWRPCVGIELTMVGLLVLTHALVGSDHLPAHTMERWSGGLVGWAIFTLFSTYLGKPIAVVLLLSITVVGLALTFDVGIADVRRAVERWQRRRNTAVRSLPPVRTSSRPAPAPPPLRSAPPPAPANVSPSPPIPATSPAPLAGAPRPAVTSAPPPSTAPPATVTSLASTQFSLPPLSLLDEPSGPPLTDAEILRKSKIIEETLAQFGLPIEVSEVRVGPTVTQFGVKPGYVERSNNVSRKVRVNQISALADDLALALAAPRLRIEAPVPGRPVVGIEVPNDKIQLVGLREVLESDEFRTLKSPLAFAVGRNVAGDPVAADLSRMPHLLIAGTTGSGKSVCIKSIITCLIFNNTPAELRLVMIDPKMVELVRFNGLPHLYGHVEVDLERVVKVLRWVAWEMDRRYKQFAAASARNIEDYNRLMRRKEAPSMPRIVVLIDELADLMMIAPDEVERTICRIAQMARATGIHLVVATQRPSTDVVTGLIKANFPARISFATASQTDSRVILDMPGAETLMGHGDMLFLPSDAGYPQRIQGCYVSEDEEDRVVAFWREQVGDWAAEAPWERIMSGTEGSKGTTGGGDEEDELLPAAIALVRETGSASASLLQRKLHIGHPRAARLMRLMEERGIVGPPEAAGRSRAVIIGGEE